MVTLHALDMQRGTLGDEGKGGAFMVEGEVSAVIPRWFAHSGYMLGRCNEVHGTHGGWRESRAVRRI